MSQNWGLHTYFGMVFSQFLTSAVMNIFADVSLEAGSVFLRVNS